MILALKWHLLAVKIIPGRQTKMNPTLLVICLGLVAMTARIIIGLESRSVISMYFEAVDNIFILALLSEKLSDETFWFELTVFFLIVCRLLSSTTKYNRGSRPPTSQQLVALEWYILYFCLREKIAEHVIFAVQKFLNLF